MLINLTLIYLLLLSYVSSERLKPVKVTENLLSHSNDKSRKLRIAVLGPFDDEMAYSINKTLPAILLATRTLESDSQKNPDKWLGGWEHGVQILYRDTNCSSTLGPLAAFDFYTTSNVDVFLGPVCPYVLAPVARYSSIWQIPVLTTAGQEESFDHKDGYRSLIRMNGSYLQVGLLFVQVRALSASFLY